MLSDREAFNEVVGQAVLAMIISRKNPPWPLDVPLEELDAAGLPSPSLGSVWKRVCSFADPSVNLPVVVLRREARTKSREGKRCVGTS